MTFQDSFPKPLGDYVRKSNIALAVSRPDEDAPLVLVNAAFCALTGYGADEVLGRNCRFLQGEDTTEEMRRPLRDFVQGIGPDSGRFPILNYRKDGSRFLNFVFMTRLFDREKQPSFILASQFDMTSSLRRSGLAANDATLQRALSDVEQIGREFGLAMVGSAQMIADSVALMARLSLDDDWP
ncbi:PAS domain-containing protein [Salipiger pacificus]|uniref:PAS domain-containing protein n=2 Tax=Salipiger mangrovisoli TaxID=2865933 RepID=A0ABR9X7D0_9RHOB|nr:PAS domain-containing protein [Salipiger mangrovisoli]